MADVAGGNFQIGVYFISSHNKGSLRRILIKKKNYWRIYNGLNNMPGFPQI